jgi:hypothetical protein
MKFNSLRFLAFAAVSTVWIAVLLAFEDFILGQKSRLAAAVAVLVLAWSIAFFLTRNETK